MRNLRQVPIRERLWRTLYLLKHSFTVVGRDRDILTPCMRTALYGIVAVIPLYLGIGLLAYAVLSEDTGSVLWGLAGIGAWVLLFLYKSFFYNHEEMCQSWLVAETVSGRDRSYDEAKQTAAKVSDQIRTIALLDMLVAWIANQQAKKSEDSGITAVLINLFISGLTEVWDLLNHYLIPAVAVDGVSITEGISRVKQLREKVPETLTGVFGIDFLGRVVGVIVGPIYLVLLLLATLVSVWLAGALPAVTIPLEGSADALPQFLVSDGALELTLIPIFAFLYLGKLFSVGLERTVTSVKVIYFTIFYMQINHPDEIAPELQDELQAYLRMEE